MKCFLSTIRVLALLWTISILTGCSSSSSAMRKPAEVVQSGTDYALVNFLRPFRGSVLGMWDNEDLVGILTSNNYIQYKARPGEHIFLAKGKENWSVIKASVQAGKTYYVLASPHMGWTATRVSLEVLKPEDNRIDKWMKDLKPIVVDPARQNAYANEWASAVQQALRNVQDGKAGFTVMNPADGR